MFQSVERKTKYFSGSRLLLSFVFAVVVLRGWIQPLSSSLLMDEMGSHYLVNGSWTDFLGRMSFTIQSPLYCTFLWGWGKAAGLSEVALRLPSVIALGAAAFLLYRFTTVMIDRTAGIFAALAFCSAPPVIKLGIQARPYAFGMLAAVIAMTLLAKWLTEKTPKAAIKCGLSVALLMYIQPLFIAMAAVTIGILFVCNLHRHKIPVNQLLLFAAVTVMSVIPILPYYLEAAKDAQTYSYTEKPGFSALNLLYVDSLLPGCLLLGLLFAYSLFGPGSFAKVEFHPLLLLILTFWMTIPPLMLFVLSKLYVPIIVDRYYSVGLPAVAIITGLLARQLEPAAVRTCVICIAALGGVLSTWSYTARPSFSQYDWREASGVVRANNHKTDTPILVRSGFVEAAKLGRLANPQYREFILAPMSVYPVAGAVFAIPYLPESDVGLYTEQLIADTVEKKNRFFLLATGSWVPWFEGRFSGKWKVKRLHPLVTEFSRE